MLLTGTFRRSIDDKGRLAIPKLLRAALGSNEPLTVILGPGTDGCLALYSPEAFRLMGERLSAGPPTRSEVRAFSRLFYARAQGVELDSQGRLRVPSDLQQIAGLQREVAVVGVRDHVELWDVGRWEQYLLEKQPHYDEIAERAFGE